MYFKHASFIARLLTALCYVPFFIGIADGALPSINLGSSNILDGGPIRPQPGWYFTQVTGCYHADKLFDGQGVARPGFAPFSEWAAVSQLVYQSDQEVIPHAKWGVNAVLPYVYSSHIDPNRLQITDSGSGVGDLILGAYLQWDPYKYRGRPLFQHRLELNVSFPTGKRDLTATINPGNGFFFINPYWAGTFYFTEHFATSWRLHYLWNARDTKKDSRAGDAIHINYSVEYELLANFWVALTGYFLQQLSNDTLHDKTVPGSRERVCGIGPGALYAVPNDIYFFGFLYIESNARNRPQGIRAVFRVVKYLS
jgi:hypothetical protein